MKGYETEIREAQRGLIRQLKHRNRELVQMIREREEDAEEQKEAAREQAQLIANYEAENKALREALKETREAGESLAEAQYAISCLKDEVTRLRRHEVELVDQMMEAAAEVREFLMAMHKEADRIRTGSLERMEDSIRSMPQVSAGMIEDEEAKAEEAKREIIRRITEREFRKADA